MKRLFPIFTIVSVAMWLTPVFASPPKHAGVPGPPPHAASWDHAAVAKYSVVSPLGKRVVEMITMVPRLDSLAGKTICLRGSMDFKANITHPKIEELLQDEYPSATVIGWQEFPGWDLNTLAQPIFTDELIAKGCEAFISGNGG